MGSFFGKGKNKHAEEPKGPVPPPARHSRRAVVPGAAPATQSVKGGAPLASARPTATVTAKTKQAPTKPVALDHDPDQLLLPASDNQVRPDTKGPIRSSNAPQFSGNLADHARTVGPCRSGDAVLIEFMVTKAKLITSDQADLVLSKAAHEELPLDAAAVALQVITEDALVNALTQECWVPHLKVDKYEIRKKALDTVSREDALHFSVFPVDKLGQLLTLAMVNPLDVDTIRILESKTNLDIKKVVATRTEILQGIEKYYSGRVVAKDTSISFTADAETEPKSVTQMLGSVKASEAEQSPAALLTPDEPIAIDIQDIDDLLMADEIIAPAIIEAKPVDAEPPLIVPIGEVFEISEPQFIDASALEARVPRTTGLPPVLESEVKDTPLPPFSFEDPPPAAPPRVGLSMPATVTPPPTTRISAAEFELDDTDAIAPAIKPAIEVRPAARTPVIPPAPWSPPTALPPAPAPAPQAPAAPVARPVTASVARPATVSVARPATATIANPGSSSSSLSPSRSATARAAGTKVVNLIPVLEEEFQHAITHGKAHVFEKWVGLQGRNRIINATPVEVEFDNLLEGLYAGTSAS